MTCVTNVNVNEDGSANVSLELCNVCWKSLLTIHSKPEEWIENAVVNRARKAGDEIYRKEVDRHLGEGTMPVGATKESLILDFNIEPNGNGEV